jgi:hypothetical protein
MTDAGQTRTTTRPDSTLVYRLGSPAAAVLGDFLAINRFSTDYQQRYLANNQDGYR